MREDKRPYISVYKPMAGWKALLVSWYAGEDMWDVTMTSPVAFKTKKEAIEYGKEWAESEGIEFKL